LFKRVHLREISLLLNLDKARKTVVINTVSTSFDKNSPALFFTISLLKREHSDYQLRPSRG